MRRIAPLLLVSSIAAADPAACPAMSNQGVAYKLVLDEIDGSPPPGVDYDRFVNKLQSIVTLGILPLWINHEQPTSWLRPPIEIVRCPGRRPTAVANFSSEVVRAMNDDNVLIELWGAVDRQQLAGGVARHRFTADYLVVPVRRYYGPQQTGGHHAFHEAPTLEAGVEAHAPEMAALANLAMALKAHRAELFNEAHTYICQTLMHLKIARRGGTTVTEWLDYTLRLTRDNLLGARSDPGYLSDRPVEDVVQDLRKKCYEQFEPRS